MLVIVFLIIFLIAYLIGSIPTAVWYGKRFYQIDVRKHGSGNSGATNTFRVLGKKAGFIVFLFDVFKGFAAASLAKILVYTELINPIYETKFMIILGMAAVVGHIYSIFLNFKGGKGVATSLGLGICIQPQVALICLLIFLVILLITHYVSLGSILSTLAFPLLSLSPWFQRDSEWLISFGFLAFALVIYTHRKNIERLLKGEESKIYLNK